MPWLLALKLAGLFLGVVSCLSLYAYWSTDPKRHRPKDEHK